MIRHFPFYFVFSKDGISLYIIISLAIYARTNVDGFYGRAVP